MDHILNEITAAGEELLIGDLDDDLNDITTAGDELGDVDEDPNDITTERWRTI